MQCRLTFLRSLASSEGLAARAAAEGGPASRLFLASLALALLCLGDSGVSLGTELCSEGPQELTIQLTACVQVMQQLHVTLVCKFAGGTHACLLIRILCNPKDHFWCACVQLPLWAANYGQQCRQWEPPKGCIRETSSRA